MLAKMVLRSRYPIIIDYDRDMDMQRRGIDAFVEGLGFIEVKTDSQFNTGNFFLEVSVGSKPGTIDHSGADFICYIFPAAHVLYLLPRPHIVKWLRDKWAWCKRNNKIKTIQSHEGRDTWEAKGVIVQRETLVRAIRRMRGKVIVIKWDESEEVLARTHWEELNNGG